LLDEELPRTLYSLEQLNKEAKEKQKQNEEAEKQANKAKRMG